MMTEKQRKAIEGMKLRMVLHVNFDEHGQLVHRNDELGLTRIIRTPKKNGRWGTGKTTWAVDGVDEEFDTIAEAAVAMEAAGFIK